MRKHSDHPQDGKSLKTFFIYAAVVVILILASLAWKAVLIIQQSKFTGQHFVLALAQNEKVKELVVFDPADESMSILRFTDAKINQKDLARQTGIATDGRINVNDSAQDVIRDNVSESLLLLALRYPTLQKDITIFDTLRLSLYSRNLPPNKFVLKEIESTDLIEDPLLRKTLIEFFSDDIVATESTSIHIINAAGVSGIAQRLERILLYKGANVVAVTTAPKREKQSKIKYFGPETYTLEKVRKLLGFKTEVLPNETIANIIIVIGEDNKDTTIF